MAQEFDRTTSAGNAGANTSSGNDLGKAKEALVQGAHHLTDEVKTAAGEAAGQVKKAAESKMDAGRDFAAERLGSVADALRKTGEELRANDSGLTTYVTKAANSVDYLSLYLQTRTLSQLMNDVEGFARREPAMFLGGSFLAGLLGGRFLKSSSPMTPRTAGGGATTTAGALPSYAGQGAYGAQGTTARGPGSTQQQTNVVSGSAGAKDAEKANYGDASLSSDTKPPAKTTTPATEALGAKASSDAAYSPMAAKPPTQGFMVGNDQETSRASNARNGSNGNATASNSGSAPRQGGR
jgi:hypothetical protein